MTRPWRDLGWRCPTCHDLVTHVQTFIGTVRYSYYKCWLHDAVDPVWEPAVKPINSEVDDLSDGE